MTSFGADIPSIKVEQSASNLQDLRDAQIKHEPDTLGASPGSQVDDDIYEDAGDLDFAGSDQNVFLTRLPKFLWDSWSKLDDDQEIQIGRVRVEGNPGDIKRMSLMLDASVPKNKSLPKEYNLHVTNPDSLNTFIFSEKDLPGYRQFQADGTPAHWLNRKRMERKKQTHAHYRKGVPKKTTLVGRVKTEVNCIPVENDAYKRWDAARTEMTLRPKAKTQLLDDVPPAGSVLNPAAGNFSNFIDKAGPRRKPQLLKTARMPQNELLDLIYTCFKQYTYWPFKVLKEKLRQPDVYLRQTLDLIAFQAKTGTHMSEWQLKPEAKMGNYDNAFNTAKDEAAPDDGLGMAYDGADDMEQDDSNVEMEDVLPE